MALSKSGPAGGKPNLGGKRPTFGGPKNGRPIVLPPFMNGKRPPFGGPKNGRPNLGGPKGNPTALKYAKGLDPQLGPALAGARGYARGLQGLRPYGIEGQGSPNYHPPGNLTNDVRAILDGRPQFINGRPRARPLAQGRGSASGRGQGELEDSRKALLTSQARRQTIAKALKLKRG